MGDTKAGRQPGRAGRLPGRTGRRPGRSDTRERILRAARRRFAADGFDRTSLRGIAGEASVDPALVLHYFGSKDRLFAAAVEWPIDLDEVASGVLAPGPDGLGERLVRLLVERWEDERTREPLAAVIRSAVGQGESAQMTREFMRREVLARLAGFLPGPTAELRVSLVAGTLAGLAITRYIMRVEPIASLPADDVVRAVGPTVQRYLTGDIA